MPDDVGMTAAVQLFPTCIGDVVAQQTATDAERVLDALGIDHQRPSGTTCCGQPAFNSGDKADAAAIARNVIAAFKVFDFVVAPSGSCGGMIVKHYPELFEPGSADHAAAVELAGRTHELVSFLTRVMKVDRVEASFPARATYHDSCSGLRELGIKAEPRRLLAGVEGFSLAEMTDAEVCCGFGGTFCVKYPGISDKMLEKKLRHIHATGADTLVAGDLGCLMNMAGKLKREGSPVKVRHIAEVLAGDTATPPIAEAE